MAHFTMKETFSRIGNTFFGFLIKFLFRNSLTHLLSKFHTLIHKDILIWGIINVTKIDKSNFMKTGRLTYVTGYKLFSYLLLFGKNRNKQSQPFNCLYQLHRIYYTWHFYQPTNFFHYICVIFSWKNPKLINFFW